MADYPYFPLYVEDFIVGTCSMEPASIGIYIRCLCYQWSHGFVPNDRTAVVRLAGALPSEVDDCWASLTAKFAETSPGRLQNVRLEREREKVIATIDASSRRGKKGAASRWSGNAQALLKHNLSNNTGAFDSDSVSDSGFNSSKEDFFAVWWSSYPKKAAKQAAAKAYRNAIKAICGRPEAEGLGGDDPHGFLLDRVKVFAASPKAKGGFCPHGATWLNEGRYDDDPAVWQDPGNSGGKHEQRRRTLSPGQQFDPAAAERPTRGW